MNDAVLVGAVATRRLAHGRMRERVVERQRAKQVFVSGWVGGHVAAGGRHVVVRIADDERLVVKIGRQDELLARLEQVNDRLRLRLDLERVALEQVGKVAILLMKIANVMLWMKRTHTNKQELWISLRLNPLAL